MAEGLAQQWNSKYPGPIQLPPASLKALGYEDCEVTRPSNVEDRLYEVERTIVACHVILDLIVGQPTPNYDVEKGVISTTDRCVGHSQYLHDRLVDLNNKLGCLA